MRRRRLRLRCLRTPHTTVCAAGKGHAHAASSRGAMSSKVGARPRRCGHASCAAHVPAAVLTVVAPTRCRALACRCGCCMRVRIIIMRARARAAVAFWQASAPPGGALTPLCALRPAGEGHVVTVRFRRRARCRKPTTRWPSTHPGLCVSFGTALPAGGAEDGGDIPGDAGGGGGQLEQPDEGHHRHRSGADAGPATNVLCVLGFHSQPAQKHCWHPPPTQPTRAAHAVHAASLR